MWFRRLSVFRLVLRAEGGCDLPVFTVMQPTFPVEFVRGFSYLETGRP